jgi:DNA-binding NarL/FixJ family response regulator
MPTEHRVRLLIVDDHAMVREGLKNTLQSYPNIDIVGEASDGEEALLTVSQLKPTVVVMDIVMPRLDGIASTRMLKTLYPQIAVVGLSVHAKSYEVNAMLEAGAFQVITKDNAVHDLYEAIQRATLAVQPAGEQGSP